MSDSEQALSEQSYCCDVHTPWRNGRKVGRTIYAQAGLEPSDDDRLIGLMDTPELAAEAVTAHNALGRSEAEGYRS